MSIILIGMGVLALLAAIWCLIFERHNIEKLVAEEIKRIDDLIKGEVSKEIEFLKKDIDVLFDRVQSVKKAIEDKK